MRLAALIAVLVLLPATQVDAAKRKGCLMPVEIEAEQTVRFGLQLRESAQGCDAAPWNAKTATLWTQIDQKFGPRFARATQLRGRAIQREYPGKVEERLVYTDGRIVGYYRSYPLSSAYCAATHTLLTAVLRGSWKAAVQRAAKARDDVLMDYKRCGG